MLVFYAEDEFSSELFDDFDKQGSITHRIAFKKSKSPDQQHKNPLLDVSKLKGRDLSKIVMIDCQAEILSL